MSKINGDAVLIKMDGTPFANSQSASFTMETNLIDCSNKGSSRWSEHLRGNRSASASIAGATDYSATFGVEGLADMIIDGTSAVLLFEGQTVGDMTLTGTVDLASFNQDANHNEQASFSGDLQVTGAVTKGTKA
jgi:predicted secreted protein